MALALLLTQVLNLLYSALVLLIVISVILSWLPQARYSPFGQLVTRLSEPLLAPIRKLIKPLSVGGGGAIDFSPLVLMLAAWLLYRVLLTVVWTVLR